jgi:hypothetical protein
LGIEIADKEMRLPGGAILLVLRSTAIILLINSNSKPPPFAISAAGHVKASVNIHGLCGTITVIMLLKSSKQGVYRDMTSDEQLRFMDVGWVYRHA